MPSLHDTHCHLDFMSNGEAVAAEALAAGTLLFANTVTPGHWATASERFSAFGNVTIGFGMHPWWVEGPKAKLAADNKAGACAETSAETCAESTEEALLPTDARASDTPRDAAHHKLSQRASHREAAALSKARTAEESPEAKQQRADVLALLDERNPAVIGEVGLDFGWSHMESRAEQLRMFEAIAAWAGKRGGKLLSIHAVRSAQEAVDVLERSGALATCQCIFHWFTGPSDLLKRAIRAHCYFSCGPRMLATGKGREYVKAIPASQLLLETDAPSNQGMPYSYAELQAELQKAADAITAIKGEEALEVITQTSERLLTRTA